MRLNWRILFNLAVTLTLLTVVMVQVDWQKTIATLQSVRTSYFVYSYMVSLACWIMLALRLQALLRPTPLQSPWYRLFLINLRSQFFGLVLPSDVGAAAARWYLVTENRVGRRLFAFITALERLMLTLGLLLCTVVPLYFVTDERLQTFRTTMLPLLTLLLAACVFIVAVFFTPLFGWFAAVCRWLAARLHYGFLPHLLSFHEDIQIYRDNKATFAEAVAMHVVFQLLTFIRIYLLFVAMNIQMPLQDILWMSMLVLLMVTVPLSFGGFGVREATFAWLLTMYGLGADQGLLLGAMMSGQKVITTILGGFVNLLVAKGVSSTSETAGNNESSEIP